MLKNKTTSPFTLKHLLLAGAFLLLLTLGAKVDLYVVYSISFTLQTLAVCLAYYYLPIRFRLGMIGMYLALGIVGVPVFNGGAGWEYFSSWPLGFFTGFSLAAFIPTPSQHKHDLLYFGAIHAVIVALGVLVMFYHGGSASSPLKVVIELLPGAIIKSIIAWFIVIAINRYLQAKGRSL
jgi:biotin transport system substrate-specific component